MKNALLSTVLDQTIPQRDTQSLGIFGDVLDRAERTEPLDDYDGGQLRAALAISEGLDTVSDAAKAHIMEWIKRADSNEPSADFLAEDAYANNEAEEAFSLFDDRG